MASLKEVKTRINSVKSTRKITSAMKMVASAKLHKAQGAIENMLPYQKKLNKTPTLSDKPTYQEAAELAHRLMDMYVAGEVDRVEIIYHHFKSMGVQILLRETYLPIDMTNVVSEEDSMNKEEVEEHEIANDYIIEPNAEELIASLIPTVLSQKIFTAAVDSNASEHAARTLAMQVATDNANELIQDLTKQYNKSRQQAITNELLDIVGGTMK